MSLSCLGWSQQGFCAFSPSLCSQLIMPSQCPLARKAGRLWMQVFLFLKRVGSHMRHIRHDSMAMHLILLSKNAKMSEEEILFVWLWWYLREKETNDMQVKAYYSTSKKNYQAKATLGFEIKDVSPLPVLFSSISCMWILLGVIRMGTGWTMAVSYWTDREIRGETGKLTKKGRHRFH